MKTRNTEQKKIILENVSFRHDHPTTQMIYDEIKRDNLDIGIATIYRNLRTMVDDGLIKKIITADNIAHYDLTTNDHIHLVCNSCGKIIDVMKSDVIDHAKLVSKYKFSIDHQDIQINGICDECQKKVV